MTQVYWKKLIVSFTFWAIAEAYCSMIGLDDFIDYGEFIFAVQETVVQSRQDSQYQPTVIEHKALLLPDLPALGSLNFDL